MGDRDTSRSTLAEELVELRSRIAELEHLKRADALLRRRMKELTALHAIAAAGAEATNLDTLFETALDVIAGTLGSHAFGIGLVGDDGTTLRIHPLSVKANEPHGDLDIPLGKGIAGRVAATGEPVRVEDTASDVDYIDLNPDMRSELCVPLRADGRVIGIFNAESRKVGAFSLEDEQLLMTFAGQLATAIVKVRLFEEVTNLAVTDPLTGLFNRRHFFKVAEQEFQRARRHERELSLIMLDLDDFKMINDSHGHAAGDRVLRSVARGCMATVRGTDLVCRFGGEEFVILLPETDLSGAVVVADEVRQVIADTPVQQASGEIKVTASLGVADCNDSCEDLDHILRRSDHALYAAKRAGRNCVRSWPVDT